ncbi:MAG: Fic/DOC family protein [Gammaproteobacteria bacterium]
MKSEPFDPYCYEGTDILKNLADCRDQQSLDKFEADMVAINLFRLTEEPIINKQFGSDYLQETHRRIFDGIFEWAGQYRHNTGHMVKKRNGHIVTYANSTHIIRELNKVFSSLSEENYLKDLDMKKFVTRVAYYYGELDAIHPFREGNSRTLRKFMADLSIQAGYRLDWSQIAEDDESRKKLYVARDLAVINADPSQLAILIEKACSPLQTLDKPELVDTLNDDKQSIKPVQNTFINSAIIISQYDAALAEYIKKKQTQAERIEKKLETLIEQTTSYLNQLRSKKPSILSFSNTKIQWQQKIQQRQRTMQNFQDRLERICEIREGMGLYQSHIEALATKKLRRKEPILTKEWDNMMEMQRLHQTLMRKKEREQANEKIKLRTSRGHRISS